MPGPSAGAMVMMGQVGDAIATPIVGLLSDKFGTKRSWHVFGSFLVLLTFPLIFAMCPFCDILPEWWKYFYFSVIILIFQFGWPVVQITHLAMIPELSRTQRDRSDLTGKLSLFSGIVFINIISKFQQQGIQRRFAGECKQTKTYNQKRNHGTKIGGHANPPTTQEKLIGFHSNLPPRFVSFSFKKRKNVKKTKTFFDVFQFHIITESLYQYK